MKVALARIVAVALGVIVAAPVAEAALRATRALKLDPWVRGFSGRAGFVDGRGHYDYHANREGFRTAEFDRLPKAGLRIAVIGDSNGWGSGVDDAERVGDRLAAALTASGRPTTALTLAWPATTFREYGEQYERARLLAPDLVLAIGTAGNDFFETVRPPRLPRSYAPETAPPTLRERLRGWHLYHLFARLAHPPAKLATTWLGTGRCAIRADDPLLAPYTQAPRQACELADPALRRAAIERTTADARRLVERVRRDGVPLLIVEVPSRLGTACGADSLSSRLLAERAQARAEAVALEAELVAELDRRLRDHLGAPLPDPRALLAGDCMGDYFPTDWHLSPSGHARLAAWLAPRVESLLSTPAHPGRRPSAEPAARPEPAA